MQLMASKMIGNKNNEEPDVNYNIRRYNIDKTSRENSKPKPTESQLALIASLRQQLNDAGVANDFIIEPDTRYVASHVIRALIRLANKYGVDTKRRHESLNGV